MKGLTPITMRILIHLKLSFHSSVKLFIFSVMSWKYCLPKKVERWEGKKLRTGCPETLGKPAPPQLRPPLPSLPCRDLDRPLESRFPSNQCTLHSDQPVHIGIVHLLSTGAFYIVHPLNQCILHCAHCTTSAQCTGSRKRQSGDEHCLKEDIMP